MEKHCAVQINVVKGSMNTHSRNLWPHFLDIRVGMSTEYLSYYEGRGGRARRKKSPLWWKEMRRRRKGGRKSEWVRCPRRKKELPRVSCRQIVFWSVRERLWVIILADDDCPTALAILLPVTRKFYAVDWQQSSKAIVLLSPFFKVATDPKITARRFDSDPGPGSAILLRYRKDTFHWVKMNKNITFSH